MDTLANIIGLIGVAFIVLAYFLNQTGKLASDHIAFPVLNLIGALLILFSLWFHWNLASFVIEVVWIAISAYGIWKIWHTKNKG